MRRTRDNGETLKRDTGCLVARQPSVPYDVQFVGTFENSLFGGERLWMETVTGPGEAWLRSLPFSRLAGRLISAGVGATRKDEGCLLGGLGSMLTRAATESAAPKQKDHHKMRRSSDCDQRPLSRSLNA